MYTSISDAPSQDTPSSDARDNGSATPRKPAIFIQDACYHHRYIRSRDTSNVFERPERLRAVSLGLSAALARLEESALHPPTPSGREASPSSDVLADALHRLTLDGSTPEPSSLPAHIVYSKATLDILNHAAVKFVHGDIEGDVYLENLKAWARDSTQKISEAGSEIPEGMNQGDLYLCPQSINAMQGALGTVCEAVDTVIISTRPPSSDTPSGDATPPASRAFVSIRPPGHHCGEDTPSGFCFVNNVAVAAAHAHLKHGITRIVIFDIDLHHGNGTQSIAWQINEETYRQTLESALQDHDQAKQDKPGLQIFYGSIHDILSYPCEDGKIDLVQAASVSLHGPHGQHIENIHLGTYSNPQHFWDVLYKLQYTRVIQKAADFVESTGGDADNVLVFISAGFDASEHEHPGMSRHGRTVPTDFFRRFAQDATAFADKYARGRLLSVLEGGYSDRALTSGAMAHLVGLMHSDVESEDTEAWWSTENLVKLEKALKKRGPRKSLTVNDPGDVWFRRTIEIFATLDTDTARNLTPTSSRAATPAVPSSMTLRDRKKAPVSVHSSPTASRVEKPLSLEMAKKADAPELVSAIDETAASRARAAEAPLSTDEPVLSAATNDLTEQLATVKKLPRVILRVGPRPENPPAS